MYRQKFKHQSLDGCYLRKADFYQTRCLFQNSHDCTLDSRKFALGLTNKIRRTVETASTQTKIRRRLKPRLHKRSPPPRTEEKNVILTAHSSTPLSSGFVCIDAVSTARSSFYVTAKEGEEFLRKLSNSRFTVCGASC